jgi:DNA-binding NtrC family response regulator
MMNEPAYRFRSGFTRHAWRHRQQPRLLLVDDEPRLLSSLYELLRDRDFHLVTATSGSEAIAHLSRSRFDLVLLDLRLPDIGGHEIMDFMNERGIDADVIVMSGEVGIDAAIGALKRGAYDYLRKPYSREELLKTVGNALSSAAWPAPTAHRRSSWKTPRRCTATWSTARPTSSTR